MKTLIFFLVISLNKSDIWGIGGVFIGLVCLGFALYQIYSSYRAKKIYENACKSRCKDAVAIVGELAKNIDYV